MEVGYDGEVYEIGFYEGDFSMPDMFNRRDYYFTDEELYAIGRADRALTVFMKFGVDGQKSYHLQLKIAVAMVPDLLAIVDESAEKLVCARYHSGCRLGGSSRNECFVHGTCCDR